MTEQAKVSNWNVPNILTAVRMVMVPIFAWVLLAHPQDPTMRWIATAVFLVAIATDALDGRIARKYNLITDFGKLWDPIADKALTGMAFIGLSILAELPWWITIIILVREWGITALRWAIMKYGVMAANRGGKLKTVMQSVALAMFLPGLQFMPAVWDIIAWIAMILAFALTVLTGLDYLREANKLRATYLAEHPEEGSRR
ncbi:CDP-diacylglycerol--glycerol-3-phosphate 3-phosphatidyltransferase [Propioniciclava coleopterorum]|uniref:CDP-diacylglycerol--glycerol-3-phosphate 3-phosphatidyltransferase n=1 Tax=Propioniciclava coleopterorum TaxID=2714937 RepID=A0A6G7Y9T7_9ACTN|nr:CDP-diacylglycerol--glycerol-3-phosphate 3-phosphatidyltransferase [Propioniciclava coleopterorum]QIK73377.1 CDP-diacylglycerol--glycerol-3-phosphate 3-phosphatidyltransferase [Propioniciclava coleopterorum]